MPLANPAKGEISVGAAGLVAVLDFRALKSLEARFKKPVTQLLLHIGAMTLDDLHHVLWVALQRHQPALTLVDVEVLIDEIGPAGLLAATGTAFRLAFGIEEDAPAAEGASPPGARSGRRTPASSSGSNSD